MTQHEKILEMHSDGQWHCGNEYRARFIFSMHKRREEITKHMTAHALKSLNYFFQDRPCAHGHKNVRDYLLITTFAAQEEKQEVKQAALI